MSRLERAIGERPQTPQIRQAIVRIDAVRGHTEQCETCVTPASQIVAGRALCNVCAASARQRKQRAHTSEMAELRARRSGR
jgi:hypothetical protein